MITKALDKLLLAGLANYRVHHHALGVYSRIPLPADSFAVVTDIVWNNFIDQYYQDYRDMTWREYFTFNEYELKLYSELYHTSYQFRNRLELVNASAITNFNAKMTKADFDKVILFPREPVILNTFLVHNKEIKIRVTRNSGFNQINTINGPLTSSANEQLPPNGIKGEKIMQQGTFVPVAGTQTQYQPPTKEYTGLNAGSRYNWEYRHNITGVGSGRNGSMIQQFDQSVSSLKELPEALTATKPLVSIGYVTISNNYESRIHNT
jgi:hypothetical protein